MKTCREFYWDWIVRTFTGGYTRTRAAALFAAIIGGAVAFFFPDVVPIVSISLWAIPLAVFVATLIIGFLLAPYSAYKETFGNFPQNDSITDSERLERARARIQAMADSINVSGVSVTPRIQSGPRKDWKSETQRVLRAIVREDICAEYDRILRKKNPDRPAKLFLEALADTLSSSHLR